MHHHLFILEIIGRILLGGFFIWSAFGHFIGLKQRAAYARSKNVPLPTTSVAFSGLLFLIGGLGILFGFHVGISAIILAITMVIITFWMHQFWNVADPMHKANEEIAFSKNLAIIGALLMLVAR